MRAVPNSLHDDVADRLRHCIFEGVLSAGAFVDEVALCAEWSISRTPLREALKVLAAEGLIRHEPRRGSFVSEVTERDLDDIFPVIAMLEGRCACEAARKVTAADLVALDALHNNLQAHAAAGRIPEYYATNYSIHEAIITLADNRWLAQSISDLRKILKLARLQQLRAPGRLAQSLSEHLAVFAAIRNHDADAADSAMRNHLLMQREALRELARHGKSRLSA
ncbi:GntR family transcriptional regulator [Rhodoferax sp.]|uniref:GntR family transcriptional regulator n=1 Tax=Rhodoferax sp. TaxID=50421 RepID=UPI0025F62DA1|nr:GntR family transcriptional regulator [Rhodoferax sp.]